MVRDDITDKTTTIKLNGSVQKSACVAEPWIRKAHVMSMIGRPECENHGLWQFVCFPEVACQAPTLF